MTSSYTTSAGTKYDFSIQDEMQAIGETKTPAMDITVVPSSSERKVEDLQVKGFDKDNYTINGTESVVLHVPEGYEGEIEISSVMEKFDLEASETCLPRARMLMVPMAVLTMAGTTKKSQAKIKLPNS